MKVRGILLFVVAMVVVGCGHQQGGDKNLTLEQVPMAVRKGIEAAYPDARVNRIVKETNEETRAVQYRVEVTTKDGKTRDGLFEPDGDRVVKK